MSTDLPAARLRLSRFRPLGDTRRTKATSVNKANRSHEENTVNRPSAGKISALVHRRRRRGQKRTRRSTNASYKAQIANERLATGLYRRKERRCHERPKRRRANSENVVYRRRKSKKGTWNVLGRAFDEEHSRHFSALSSIWIQIVSIARLLFFVEN